MCMMVGRIRKRWCISIRYRNRRASLPVMAAEDQSKTISDSNKTNGKSSKGWDISWSCETRTCVKKQWKMNEMKFSTMIGQIISCITFYKPVVWQAYNVNSTHKRWFALQVKHDIPIVHHTNMSYVVQEVACMVVLKQFFVRALTTCSAVQRGGKSGQLCVHWSCWQQYQAAAVAACLQQGTHMCACTLSCTTRKM